MTRIFVDIGDSNGKADQDVDAVGAIAQAERCGA
jgi:hypothetical protein